MNKWSSTKHVARLVCLPNEMCSQLSWFSLGCLTSQQHAQCVFGCMCSDNCTFRNTGTKSHTTLASLPSNSIVVYWHQANQSYKRCLAGHPWEYQFISQGYESNGITRLWFHDLPHSWRSPYHHIKTRVSTHLTHIYPDTHMWVAPTETRICVRE